MRALCPGDEAADCADTMTASHTDYLSCCTHLLVFACGSTGPILEAEAKLRKERAAMKLVTGDEAGDCKQQ